MKSYTLISLFKVMKSYISKAGCPGAYISQDESLDYDLETFEKQKSTIKPRPYDFKRMINYLEDHYDLKEKTLSPVEIRMFEANLEHLDYYDKEHFSPIFLDVVRNEKSCEIYKEHPEDDIIFIYIEKNCGYIDTNSAILQKKLFEIRGVTQEEYDRNSQKLFELIGVTFHNL